MSDETNEIEKYWFGKAALLAMQFRKDYKDAALLFPAEKRIDLYEHLKDCIAIGEQMLSDDSNALWKHYLEIESNFFKKQGSRLKIYTEKNMAIYYNDEKALLKKGVFSPEEWEKLEPEKRIAPAECFIYFYNFCRGLLINECNNYWLEQPPLDEAGKPSYSGHPLAAAGIKAAKEAENKRRKAVDKATTLSQEQSVLLLHYLKEAKIFLRENNLSDKDAGIAFGILTGFSHDTIRQKLGRVETIQNHDNLEFLYNYLVRLQSAIEKDLKTKKKNN